MASSQSGYQIIDEPKTKAFEHLIVNPIVVLLVGILLPLLWMPPFYGRIWIPLVWVVVNSYLLGSPTFKSEALIAIIGGLLCLAMPFALVFGMYLFSLKAYVSASVPYIILINQAIFFLTLYLIVLKQMVPYELYQYIKTKAHK